MKLLHIDSGIQGDASASRILSAAIVGRLRALDPNLTYSYRDLVADPLPHLTLEAFAAQPSQDALAEFQAADTVVIGAGMYNFTIPTQLKTWIDRILVAGQTFRYGAGGVEGLAGGKRVIVALARGGLYGEGAPAAALEHAETYLRGVLAFIGIGAPEFVIAEGLALGDEARSAALNGALAHVNRIADRELEAA